MTAAMKCATIVSDSDHADEPGSRRGVLDLSNGECPVNRHHPKPGIRASQVHRIGANGWSWARRGRMLDAVADARKNHADMRTQTKTVEHKTVHRKLALREVIPFFVRLQAVVIDWSESDRARHDGGFRRSTRLQPDETYRACEQDEQDQPSSRHYSGLTDRA